KDATNLTQDLDVRIRKASGEETTVLELQYKQQNELIATQEKGLSTGSLLLTQQTEMNKLLHDQQLAKAVKDTQTFFDTIKTAISSLVSSGNTLVTSYVRPQPRYARPVEIC
ncbi:MAG: hypothetical protein JZU65_05185, partial [Chlorobium sp.]|nr:hypothetical protein [Chlorobium sp.]